MTNTERTITAMYDSRADAEAARGQLTTLGISSADVSIEGPKGEAAATTTGRTEERGFWASLFGSDGDDRHVYSEGVNRGGYLLAARVPPGMEDEAIAVLERSGAVDMDERTASWRQSGWRDHDPAAAAPAATVAAGAPVAMEDAGVSRSAATTAGATGTTGALGVTGAAPVTGERRGTNEDRLQVVEEQLRVGKREVGRGSVRVRSYVREIPVEEQVELRREHVTIERRPVNRELRPDDPAFEERTIEAVERGEEAVVSKSARVVEEIAVRKEVEREVETVRDTVRRQDVEVEDERATGGVRGAGRAAVTDVDDGTLPPSRTTR